MFYGNINNEQYITPCTELSLPFKLIKFSIM